MVKKICIAVIVGFLFSLFYENLLRWYADFFVVDTATRGADAIVVLGGNSRTRIPQAITLLKNGYGKTILLTQPRRQQIKYKFIQSEYDIAKLILKHEKIHYATIPSLKPGGATSTLEEAYDVANFLKRYRLHKIIIVTDAFHTHRALYTFQKVFRSEDIYTKVEVAPAFSHEYKVYSWWKSEQGLTDYITEFFKFVIYFFTLWNI